MCGTGGGKGNKGEKKGDNRENEDEPKTNTGWKEEKRVKTMNCRQLGGPCDIEHRGKTAWAESRSRSAGSASSRSVLVSRFSAHWQAIGSSSARLRRNRTTDPCDATVNSSGTPKVKRRVRRSWAGSEIVGMLDTVPRRSGGTRAGCTSITSMGVSPAERTAYGAVCLLYGKVITIAQADRTTEGRFAVGVRWRLPILVRRGCSPRGQCGGVGLGQALHDTWA